MKPGERKRIAAIMSELQKLDFSEVEEITKRLREARRRFPSGSVERRSWEAVGQLTPGEVSGWWQRLKDPMKRRGRPSKPWPQRRDADLLPQMQMLISAGVSRTTAARSVLESKGVKVSLKSRSDNLVRLFNRQHPDAL